MSAIAYDTAELPTVYTV